MTPDSLMFDQLRNFDTPTICNALEMIDPRRRDFGFTRHSMHCLNAKTGPIVGFARTATMRALGPSHTETAVLKRERLAYYAYVQEGSYPKVAVMQDLDGRERGIGPFWGEFNTRIHVAMGCVAIVTDGSVRDVAKLPDDILIISDGLRPSHAHVHVTGFGVQVNVGGMYVASNDLIHADEHGAVTFPYALSHEVVQRAAEFVASEHDIIEACKSKGLTFEELSRLYMRR